MTDSEFLELADSTLNLIEAALERASVDEDLDIECSRSGNVLEVEIIENGSKIIINSQAPMQEIWIAAKSGGFHFKCAEGKWRDTRAGTELFVSLSEIVSKQSGTVVMLAASGE